MTPNAFKSIRTRMILVGVCFSLAMLGIAAKAVYIQILQGSRLSRKAADQYEKSLHTAGKRGLIRDRKLRDLAVSIEGGAIGAYPGRIRDLRAAAAALAGPLDTAPAALRQRLEENRSFVWLERQVPPQQLQRVADLKIDGIDFVKEHVRVYPHKHLAAQLIGFCGVDGHGLEGLEYFYEPYLKGDTVTLKVFKDALGRSIGAGPAPHHGTSNSGGQNLVLTVDRTIQFIAEEALAEAAENFAAESGIAVVMAPHTGAVLALAHYPFFNPNAFSRFQQEQWRNRAITDAFEPGSTLKIFTAAAALESKACDLATPFFCEEGAYRVGGHVVHDTKPHGWLTLPQIVQVSSNIGAVKIAEMIGPQAFYGFLKNFGFGEKTGIDCPGETSGRLSHWQHWSRIDAGAIAFGQGLAVSAIQLTAAAAAIANDGRLMRPYIVQAITDANGRIVRKTLPKTVRQVVSPRTAQAVRRIMETVVGPEGTGRKAALQSYSVCGKTGTAQKADKSGAYAQGRFIASFVGFAPAEAPAAVILVVLDEPRKHHYGGVVAAPAFRRIAEETLTLLNIESRPPGERLRADAGADSQG